MSVTLINLLSTLGNSAAVPLTASPCSCSLGTQATYCAILNGTSDLLTAGEILNHIEDWRES